MISMQAMMKFIVVDSAMTRTAKVIVWLLGPVKTVAAMGRT